MENIKLNKTPIIIVSMKRGGQHAIINWLAHQIDEEVHHYNCCVFHNENEIIPTRGDWVIEYKDGKKTDFLKTNRKRTINMLTMPEKQLILNFEDFSVEDVVSKLKFNDYILIVIIRDAFNMFASSLKWVRVNKNNHGVNYYKNNHKARVQKILGHYASKNTTINYNKWVVDKEYRDTICSWYNLQNNEKGVKEVSNIGLGSSFDGQKFDNNADKMKVLERYKEFLNDEEYLKMVSDDTLKKETKRIFGIEI